MRLVHKLSGCLRIDKRVSVLNWKSVVDEWAQSFQQRRYFYKKMKNYLAVLICMQSCLCVIRHPYFLCFGILGFSKSWQFSTLLEWDRIGLIVVRKKANNLNEEEDEKSGVREEKAVLVGKRMNKKKVGRNGEIRRDLSTA